MVLTTTDQRSPVIRLAIADIDETLMTDKKLLTPRSVQAVHRLSDAGIIFGVTTGRPPAGVRMLVEALPPLRFIAGFNGGVVVSRDFIKFRENLLPSEKAKQVVKIILEHKVDVWRYSDWDWFVRDPHAYRVDREQKTGQFPPKITPTFDLASSYD